MRIYRYAQEDELRRRYKILLDAYHSQAALGYMASARASQKALKPIIKELNRREREESREYRRAHRWDWLDWIG